MKCIFSTIKLNLNTGRKKTKNIYDDVTNVLETVDLEVDSEEYSHIYGFLIQKTVTGVNEETDPKIVLDELEEVFPAKGAHKLGDAISLYFKYDDTLRKNIHIQNLYSYIITHTSRIDVLYYALDVFTSLYFIGVSPLPSSETFRILSMYDPFTKMAEVVYRNIWEADDIAKTKLDYKHVAVAQDKADNLKLNREFVNKYLTERHNDNALRSRLVKSSKPNTLYDADYNSDTKDYMKIEQASKLLSRLYYCEENEIVNYIAQIDAFFNEFREGKKNNAKTLADSLLDIKGLDKLHLFRVALEIFYHTTNVTVMNVALCLFYELPYYIFNSAFWTDVEKMVYVNPLAAKALQLLSKNSNEVKFILNIARLGAINVTHCALKALVLMTKDPSIKLTRADFDIIVNKSWRRAMRKEECIIAIFDLYRIPTRIKQNLLTKSEYSLIKEYLTILTNLEARHNITEISFPTRFFERYIPRAKTLGIDIQQELQNAYKLFSELDEKKMKELPSPLSEVNRNKVLEIIKKGLN